ncbi:MAG: bacteriohemerythrin [Candidatus Altiarchaeota archaeon]
MPQIEWSPELSMGIEKIDDQHRRFVDLVNRLDKAVQEGDYQKAIKAATPGILDYSKTHFATEEDYMLRFDYSGYQEHKLEHAIFKEKIEAFLSDYKKDPSNPRKTATELHAFLTDWLREHLSQVDRHYVKCFKKNGLT